MEKTNFKKGDQVLYNVMKFDVSKKLHFVVEDAITATFVGMVDDTYNCVIEYDDIIRVVRVYDLRKKA